MNKFILIPVATIAFAFTACGGNDTEDRLNDAWNKVSSSEQELLCFGFNLLGEEASINEAVESGFSLEEATATADFMKEEC